MSEATKIAILLSKLQESLHDRQHMQMLKVKKMHCDEVHEIHTLENLF